MSMFVLCSSGLFCTEGVALFATAQSCARQSPLKAFRIVQIPSSHQQPMFRKNSGLRASEHRIEVVPIVVVPKGLPLAAVFHAIRLLVIQEPMVGGEEVVDAEA
mmetsp:Transcript_6769/g.18393  ORF Transcript_6769/g.18393 Transcript_6769/m.18393 type:complete len:104 (+) Transcript_6769:15-326(+)